MKITRWTLLSSMLIALTVDLCLVILIPRFLWTIPGMVSAILVGLSFLIPNFVALSYPRKGEKDATRIWSIGPIAALFIILLLIALAGLASALYGSSRLAWTADVAWVGLDLSALTLLKPTLHIVANAASGTRQSSGDDRSLWLLTIQRALDNSQSEDVKKSLAMLSESVRFASNGADQHLSEDGDISDLINAIGNNVATPETMQPIIKKTQDLLNLRNIRLKQSKSKSRG